MTYYGKTPKGKRVHMGSEVIPYITSDGRTFMVKTLCGAHMLQRHTDLDPGLRLEFCQTCFRSMAWQLLQEHFSREAGLRAFA